MQLKMKIIAVILILVNPSMSITFYRVKMNLTRSLFSWHSCLVLGNGVWGLFSARNAELQVTFYNLANQSSVTTIWSANFNFVVIFMTLGRSGIRQAFLVIGDSCREVTALFFLTIKCNKKALVFSENCHNLERKSQTEWSVPCKCMLIMRLRAV